MKAKVRDVSKLPPPNPKKGGRGGAKRTLRGPSHRSAEQREADLAFISERLIRGVTQKEIVQQLGAVRPYKVTLDIIKGDSGELTKRWRSLAIGDIEEQKAEQLARILELERQAWAALARLESGIERTVARTTEYTAKTRRSKSAMKVKDTKDNTAAWLRAIQFCIQERSKILGLYAPVKLDAKGANINFGDVTNNNFVGVEVNITTDKPVEELAAFEIIEADAIPNDETAGD